MFKRHIVHDYIVTKTALAIKIVKILSLENYYLYGKQPTLPGIIRVFKRTGNQPSLQKTKETNSVFCNEIIYNILILLLKNIFLVCWNKPKVWINFIYNPNTEY